MRERAVVRVGELRRGEEIWCAWVVWKVALQALRIRLE
jgi:hypothetical protein